MILNRVNFDPIIARVKNIFRRGLGEARYRKISGPLDRNLSVLSKANLAIYQVNMKALDFRRKKHKDLWVYSKLELQARKSSEQRVQSKSKINLLVSGLYPINDKRTSSIKDWMSDDVVFSVAESIDRILIETIKCADYIAHLSDSIPVNARAWREKIILSERWGSTVEDFLKNKLKEINRKGYYECIQETRTYNLKGIRQSK
jgi:hypothetical protein